MLSIMSQADVTRFEATDHREPRHGRIETQLLDPRPETTGTTFVSLPNWQPFERHSGNVTSFAIERKQQVQRGRDGSGEAKADVDEIEGLANARRAFIEHRYAGRESPEDSARFELLTQRLRRLAPRRTAEGLAVLEEKVTDLEQTDRRLDELSRRFGLK